METLPTILSFGDVILSFGIVASLLLAMAVLIRIRDNPAANLWLLVLLVASLAGMVLKYLDHNDLLSQVPHLYRLNRPIGLLRPVSLYLYIWYLLNPRPARWRDLVHFIPVFALVTYLGPVFLLSTDEKIRLMAGQFYHPHAHLPGWYPFAGIFYSFVYWALSVRAYLRSNLRALDERRSKPAEKMRRWIVGFLVLSLVFLVAVSLTLAAGPSRGYLFFQLLSILIVLACIAVLSSARLVTGELAPRYEKSGLTPLERATHADALRRLLQQDQIYRQSGLRLGTVAQALGVTDQVLSQVISEELGASFSEVVNTYRVEAAKDMLRSPEYSNFSTEGIGQEAGFGSRASFYSAFKRMTGSTPAGYRKLPPE